MLFRVCNPIEDYEADVELSHEKHKRSSLPLQQNSKSNKSRTPFYVTPLFHHQDVGADVVVTHPTIDLKQHASDVPSTASTTQYRRRVIQRIVTPLPWKHVTANPQHHSMNQEDDLDNGMSNDGEVEVCLEDYYAIHHELEDTSPQGQTEAPLFRRVAVRSYGQVIPNDIKVTGQSAHADTSTLNEKDQFHADSHMSQAEHASFTIPLGPLPGYPQYPLASEWNTLNGCTKSSHDPCIHEQASRSVYQESCSPSLLCWAKFESYDEYRLCVLASPTNLHIFDVYPHRTYPPDSDTQQSHPKHNVSSKDSDIEVKVTLPFEAISIFALPRPFGGLIIQRSSTMGERTHVKRHRNTGQGNMNHSDINPFEDLIEENRPIATHFMKQSSLMDLPTLFRNESSMPSRLRPRLELYRQMQEKSSDKIDVPTIIASHFDEHIVPSTSPHSSTSSKQENFIHHHERSQFPSIFSLHHPLADIKPCGITESSQSQTNNDPNIITSSPPCLNLNGQHESNQTHALFTDVDDIVVFVGKPRSFFTSSLSTPFSSLRETSSDINDRPKKEVASLATHSNVIIVVTYHLSMKRHAVWLLHSAPPPPPTLPLWKQNSLLMANGHGRKEMEIFVKDSVRRSDVMDEGIVLPSSSPFMEIHAEISLSCISSTFDDHLSSLSSSAKDVSGMRASDIFLATTEEESGDFILCVVRSRRNGCEHLNEACLPTKRSTVHTNNKLLSCYKIYQPSSDPLQTNKHLWRVAHLSDFPCIAAQPIHATPLCPPQYILETKQQLESSSVSFYNGWWMRRALSPPSAIDILICAVEDGDGGEVTLRLFRGCSYIVDCDMTLPDSSYFLSLRLGVADRVDVVYGHNGCVSAIRASINLRVVSSPLTETALLAIGSVFCRGMLEHVDYESKTVMNIDLGSEDFQTQVIRRLLIRFALHVRSDCLRLSQGFALKCDDSHDDAFSWLDDVFWHAFSTLLLSLFQIALNGSEVVSDEIISPGSVLSANTDSNYSQSWDRLLQSDYHRHHGRIDMYFGKQLRFDATSFSSIAYKTRVDSILCDTNPTSVNILNSLSSYRFKFSTCIVSILVCKNIFDSLHMLYEDCKVTKSSRDFSWNQRLGTFLYKLCSPSLPGDHVSITFNLMQDYMDYYQRDLGESLCCLSTSERSDSFVPTRLSNLTRPPSAYIWLEQIMKNGEADFGVTVLNGTCVSLRTLLHLYSIMFSSNEQSVAANGLRIIDSLISEGIEQPESVVEMFPSGTMLPIMEALQRCKDDPPSPSSATPWFLTVYRLIGRNDLGAIQESFSRHRLARKPWSKASNAFNNLDTDGLDNLSQFSSMIFPDDLRVREAARLLRSSRPMFLYVEKSMDVNDHAFERLKQDKLHLLCRRQLALPLGRGMLTIGTLENIPAEPLPVPKMNLAGRIPPNNAHLNLDVTASPQDMSVWPDFHNGVASSLRLPTARSDTHARKNISRTWIASNRTAQMPTVVAADSPPGTYQQNHFHGGFLMGLGLRGHLSTALTVTDLYEYLTQGSVTITVGILLGMAANKLGTCDPSVTKILCLHIPSLLPPSFATIEVTSAVQTSAIVGIGLLYQASNHRMMTEFLLNELGKRPTNNPSDREAYSLCCGLALGMVNLKMDKTSETGLFDLHIEQRLHRYIVGGRNEYEAQKYGDFIERNNILGGASCDNERTSLIFEGDTINIDVTAPGAILALGLIYIRSGNKMIASILNIPDTLFYLNYIRPDFLFLKIVSRSLILWDDIEPSDAWVNGQIPTILQNIYEEFAVIAQNSSGMAELASFASMSMEEGRIDGGANVSHSKTLINEGHNSIDRPLIRQAYTFIVAGACFSLGLRYAGTGDTRAKATILRKTLYLMKLRDESDPVTLARRPEKQIVDMCLGSAAVALAMVMAGTGDLETFRILRMLRWKCDDTVKYGTHMAFGTAIGLLFLGGGSCSIGNEPADIAALIIAFFPRFPVQTSDNQYHLQALRHLYALSVQERLVEAVDVETRSRIYLPVEVVYEDDVVHSLRAPCLLLNKARAKSLRVKCDRYYKVEINLKGIPRMISNITLYVKQKTGQLSFQQDPDGLRTLQIQTGVSNQLSDFNFIKCFTDGTYLSQYLKYLCYHSSQEPIKRHHFPHGTLGCSCMHALHDCLTRQIPEAVPVYLAIYEIIEALQNNGPVPTWKLWNLRMIRSYFECRLSNRDDPIGLILSVRFVALLCEKIDKLFHTLDNLDGCDQDCLYWKNALGSFFIWHNRTITSQASIDD